MDEEPVILFDGSCSFCDAAVHFVVERERAARLKFAALQSEQGAAVLARTTSPDRARILREGASGAGDPDTVVFVEGGHIYTHSTAALRVARHLRWPWRALALFVVVPRPLRDFVYRGFARNRHRWFGKTTCRVPTAALRARFL